MPINPRMSYEEIVREIIRSYKEDGKIGNIRPKSMRHALRIANAIASRVKNKPPKKKSSGKKPR